MGFIEFYTIFPDFVHYSRVSVLADFVISVLERLELLFETLLGLQRKLNKKNFHTPTGRVWPDRPQSD